MLRILMMKRVAIGLVLVGAVAGAAGAQVARNAFSSTYLNTGPFTVAPEESIRFHVSLDDFAAGPPATVILRLFDERGGVLARQEATLQPGQSTTLTADPKALGVFRAHAEVLDPLLQLSRRRAVVGTVELVNNLTTEIRLICSFDQGGVGGARP